MLLKPRLHICSFIKKLQQSYENYEKKTITDLFLTNMIKGKNKLVLL